MHSYCIEKNSKTICLYNYNYNFNFANLGPLHDIIKYVKIGRFRESCFLPLFFLAFLRQEFCQFAKSHSSKFANFDSLGKFYYAKISSFLKVAKISSFLSFSLIFLPLLLFDCCTIERALSSSFLSPPKNV